MRRLARPRVHLVRTRRAVRLCVEYRRHCGSRGDGPKRGPGRRASPRQALLLRAAGGCSTSSEAAAVTVQIANFAFDPPEVTAKVGETIGWTNGDSTAHTATTDDGGCDTGNIAQNATAGLVFDAAGTYAYHCKIHPNMTGTITITE